jgi:peptidoglycan/LPS O-acetylase OafA/YrhL
VAAPVKRGTKVRVKELDGLRGIAIISVICVHYFSWVPLPRPRHGWLINLLLKPVDFVVLLPRSGSQGVTLFFVLSGFLITTILLELRHHKHFFGVFYSRRAFRILPPYMLGLFVYIVSSFALGKPGSWGLWLRYIFYYSSLLPHLPRELTAVPPLLPIAVCGGILPLWSLSVEELYYTFWAPVIRYISEKGLIAIIAAMLLSAPLLRFLLFFPLNGDGWYTFYCQMDGLACGSGVALLLYARSSSPGKWLPTDRIFDRLCAVFAVSLVLFNVLGNYGAFSARLFFTLNTSLAALCFAFVVYAALRKSGGDRLWLRSLRAPWLRSVGKVSYSLYLFHIAVIDLVESLLRQVHVEGHELVLLGHALALLLSFGVAYSLWYGLESPILRWKDRLVPSRSPKFSGDMPASQRRLAVGNEK